MKFVAAAIVTVALAGLVWGAVAGSRPVAPRATVRAVPVDQRWYDALPADPERATQAFLARVPGETRARADAFAQGRYVALGGRLLALVASTVLIMFTGLCAAMRRGALRVSRRRWLQDAVFAVQYLLVLLLLGLPVEVFAGFVRYREAGLSRLDFPRWLADYVLQWSVDLAFYVVGIVAIMALVRRRPRSWMGWATGVYVLLYAVYVFVAPLYIEPLFNRYTALSAGPIKDRILSLARANGVPADDVWVRDASRQSVILNANVSGFAGTARITLDDNTVAGTPPAEIELVMAHEIGHYVLAHLFKEWVMNGLVMGAGFVFVAFAWRALIARYGRRWDVAEPGDIGALPVFWFLVTLWGFIALPLVNTLQREDEREADLFGLNASGRPFGLAEFMLRDADVSPLDQPPVVEWAFDSHPTPANRIRTAMRWRAEHLPR